MNRAASRCPVRLSRMRSGSPSTETSAPFLPLPYQPSGRRQIERTPQLRRHPAQLLFVAAGEETGLFAPDGMNLKLDQRHFVDLHAAGVGANGRNALAAPVPLLGAEDSDLRHAQP